MLEVPAALLSRLYDIEEISATRLPLQSGTPASKKRAAGGARPEPPDSETRREGLGDEEAANFLRAFGMSEDENSFPARVAWELQSEFWPQPAAEVRDGGGIRWRRRRSFLAFVLPSSATSVLVVIG